MRNLTALGSRTKFCTFAFHLRLSGYRTSQKRGVRRTRRQLRLELPPRDLRVRGLHLQWCTICTHTIRQITLRSWLSTYPHATSKQHRAAAAATRKSRQQKGLELGQDFCRCVGQVYGLHVQNVLGHRQPACSRSAAIGSLGAPAVFCCMRWQRSFIVFCAQSV